jgi:CheY-like chemotaxis protein
MMTATEKSELVMLLVEDNPADVMLVQEAIEANDMRTIQHIVGDGFEAMQFLRREEAHADAPRPDVVILDLNLPIKTGQEVLKEMAADAALRDIPVAVLTTSTSETWVCKFYPPGRCAYFVKTDDFGRLREIVREIARHASASGQGCQ